MAILSSPGHKKGVVKPHARPGGVDPNSSSLGAALASGPSSPIISATSEPAVMAGGVNDWHEKNGYSRPAETAPGASGSAASGPGDATYSSPTHPPLLPPNPHTSWTPQSRRGGSAFSVPATRARASASRGPGTGRGGRGAESIGSAGLGGLSLGGFRAVGGDTANAQVCTVFRSPQVREKRPPSARECCVVPVLSSVEARFGKGAGNSLRRRHVSAPWCCRCCRLYVLPAEYIGDCYAQRGRSFAVPSSA